MTLAYVLSCDGHRYGQSCRGARPGGPVTADPHDLLDAARVEGWRRLADGGDLCPSRGHDEESEPWSTQGPTPPPPL